MTYIIPTTNAEHLTTGFKKSKDIKIVYLDKNKDGRRYFPDKEVFVSVSKGLEIKDNDHRVVVLHSGMPLPNRGVVELEMVLAFLKQEGIQDIEVFFSYFSYGMQDKIYNDGEINAAENIVKKLTEYYHVKKIFVFDPHFYGQEWVNKYPIIDISAFPILSEAVLNDYPEAIFVTPDEGGKRRTKLNGGNKKRKNSFEIDFEHSDELCLAVNEKVVAVVDDIIETGGTMSKFAEKCFECGAKDVLAVASHGVLLEGIQKIRQNYTQLYLTNSIDQAGANVDISELIFETIKNN